MLTPCVPSNSPKKRKLPTEPSANSLLNKISHVTTKQSAYYSTKKPRLTRESSANQISIDCAGVELLHIVKHWTTVYKAFLHSLLQEVPAGITLLHLKLTGQNNNRALIISAWLTLSYGHTPLGSNTLGAAANDNFQALNCDTNQMSSCWPTSENRPVSVHWTASMLFTVVKRCEISKRSFYSPLTSAGVSWPWHSKQWVAS